MTELNVRQYVFALLKFLMKNPGFVETIEERRPDCIITGTLKSTPDGVSVRVGATLNKNDPPFKKDLP